MRIKVLESVAGENYSYGPGDVLELEGRVAYDLLSGGIAELIPEIEAAVIQAPEVAVARGRGGRRRGQRSQPDGE